MRDMRPETACKIDDKCELCGKKHQGFCFALIFVNFRTQGLSVIDATLATLKRAAIYVRRPDEAVATSLQLASMTPDKFIEFSHEMATMSDEIKRLISVGKRFDYYYEFNDRLSSRLRCKLDLKKKILCKLK